MLILSRFINEAVMIGDDIEVNIVSVSGKKVLLGFKAPRIIPIHREEIYQQIKFQKNMEAQNKLNDTFYKYLQTS